MPQNPTIPYEGPPESIQDRRARQVRESLAEADARASDPPAQGSLAARRQREAAAYARTLLRDLAHSPVLKTGRTLEAGERAALVSDYLEDKKLPASVRESVRATASEIVEMVAGGNRQDADNLAREQSVILGNRLSRTSWDGDTDDDDFDPRAIVAQISRDKT